MPKLQFRAVGNLSLQAVTGHRYRLVVDSETVNPLDLFDKPIRYVVPLYQRPYVWEKEKQWKPLWEDIVRTAESFDALVAAGAKPEEARHSGTAQRR